MIFTYLFVFILYIILLLVSKKRYYLFFPTLLLYPNNNDEVKIVKNIMNTRSQSDILFFKKTDPSVSYAFEELLPQYSDGELDTMFSKYNIIIYFFKYSINRARPIQIDNNLNILESTTANSPAYPAGHAFQGYLLAKLLAKKHPEKRQELEHIAEKCNIVRIKAGLHYPSDGLFSKKIVNYLL